MSEKIEIDPQLQALIEKAIRSQYPEKFEYEIYDTRRSVAKGRSFSWNKNWTYEEFRERLLTELQHFSGGGRFSRLMIKCKTRNTDYLFWCRQDGSDAYWDDNSIVDAYLKDIYKRITTKPLGLFHFRWNTYEKFRDKMLSEAQHRPQELRLGQFLVNKCCMCWPDIAIPIRDQDNPNDPWDDDSKVDAYLKDMFERIETKQMGRFRFKWDTYKEFRYKLLAEAQHRPEGQRLGQFIVNRCCMYWPDIAYPIWNVVDNPNNPWNDDSKVDAYLRDIYECIRYI